MTVTHAVVPCLWFDDQAEPAAQFYTTVFDSARINKVTRYGSVGQEVHGKTPGSVMTVEFEIAGQRFTALNGGPQFTFNEAISFQIFCEDQGEIDDYWEKLTRGGDERAQQCGWLKDRFGVSWQVVPKGIDEILGDPNSESGKRVFAAMLQMKKLDIAAMQQAAKG